MNPTGSGQAARASATIDLEAAIHANVTAALAEDVGDGDLTAALVDAGSVVGAKVIAREPLVLAGQAWFDQVFSSLDRDVVVDWYIHDGQSADADDVVCKLVGDARSILTGERTALNFLQTLSGTATVTAQYVAAIEGTGAKLLDTRKTLPGLRLAQKYAVRCGGGHNHRIGLYDAILVKENHIRSAGGIRAALELAARYAGEDVPVEIEVEDLDEFRQALDANASRVLLDNFPLPDLRAAVGINSGYGYARAELEASGNVTLDNIHAVADTGVDYISTGALTKNVRAADLSLLLGID